MDESNTFVDALHIDNKEALQLVRKSDKHNHAGLGYRLNRFCAFAGTDIPKAGIMNSIAELDQYIKNWISPYYKSPESFEFALNATLEEAKEDGVFLLEMSIDIIWMKFFKHQVQSFFKTIDTVGQTVSGTMDFRPEIGIARGQSIETLEEDLEQFFYSGVFRSIDLYGDEEAAPINKYKKCFREAAHHGLKLKAHVGEFGNAEAIKEAVEALELQEVQHGIAAATDKNVMRWLADNKIVLNICPTSNIRLSRVASYKTHPARILFDSGVKITINSDDIMLFDATVSDEYRNLYHAGLFNAEELNAIRIAGLST
jgi:adenosine deaminase